MTEEHAVVYVVKDQFKYGDSRFKYHKLQMQHVFTLLFKVCYNLPALSDANKQLTKSSMHNGRMI